MKRWIVIAACVLASADLGCADLLGLSDGDVMPAGGASATGSAGAGASPSAGGAGTGGGDGGSPSGVPCPELDVTAMVFEAAGDDVIRDIAALADGGIVATGEFRSELKLNGLTYASDAIDGFIARFDNIDQASALRRITGSGVQRGKTVAVAGGEVFVGATWFVAYGIDDGADLETGGSDDAVVFRLDDDLVTFSTRSLVSTTRIELIDAVPNSDGSAVWAVGALLGSVDTPTTISSQGAQNPFFIKLDNNASMTTQTAGTLTTTGSGEAVAAATTESGGVALAGSAFGDITLLQSLSGNPMQAGAFFAELNASGGITRGDYWNGQFHDRATALTVDGDDLLIGLEVSPQNNITMTSLAAGVRAIVARLQGDDSVSIPRTLSADSSVRALEINGVVTLESGHIIIVGHTTSAVVDLIDYTVQGTLGHTGFVIMVDNNGNYCDSFALQSLAETFLHAATIDGDGDVWIGGQMSPGSRRIVRDNDETSISADAGTHRDALLVKLTPR